MLPERIAQLEVSIAGRARKLFAGRHGSRSYPAPEELLRFGTQVCKTRSPGHVLQRIAQGMSEVLVEAASDDRIPADLLERMRQAWQTGLSYAG